MEGLLHRCECFLINHTMAFLEKVRRLQTTTAVNEWFWVILRERERERDGERERKRDFYFLLLRYGWRIAINWTVFLCSVCVRWSHTAKSISPVQGDAVFLYDRVFCVWRMTSNVELWPCFLFRYHALSDRVKVLLLERLHGAPAPQVTTAHTCTLYLFDLITSHPPYIYFSVIFRIEQVLH